jgi:uncharacterized RmlC-like cupin family protein
MHFRARRAYRRAVVFFAIAAGLAAQRQTPIENDQVKVIKVTDQPRVKTALHEHKLNRVMIYFVPGRQDITYQDGRKVNLEFKAGEVKWSPAGGMHVSEVVSGTPSTVVELEIKKEGDPGKAAGSSLDPVKVAPKNYKVEFENAQVRVVRVTMGPHQAVPLHEHTLNRVVVYITDQNSRMTSPDGKTDIAQHKAGEASWGAPAKHREENLNDKPFEAVVIEFKS